MKLTDLRIKELNQFCSRLGIKFHNLIILNRAFTHSSYSNEVKGERDNESLEFLGDAVLELCITDYLYVKYGKIHNEGELSKIRSANVSEDALCRIAKQYGVSDLLILGKGELSNNGKNKQAILADCVEAIIGAYYLDSGLEETKLLIKRLLSASICNTEKSGDHDYKSLLQEYSQRKYNGLTPVYNLVKVTGPENSPTFYMSVKIGDQLIGPCEGSNKKVASMNVAKLAVKLLGITYKK